MALVGSFLCNIGSLFLYAKYFVYNVGVQAGQQIAMQSVEAQITKALADGKIYFNDGKGSQVVFVRGK